MPTETGVASDLTQLFNNLRAFATSNAGFTNGGTQTINGNTVHVLSKGSVFWNFEETITRVLTSPNPDVNVFLARCRMTYSAPTSTFNQTTPIGQKRFTNFGTYKTSGPFAAYKFYTEGNAVHVVLETSGGVFNHLSFGNVIKHSTWEGGEYLTAGDYQSVLGVGDFSNIAGSGSSSVQLPFQDHEGNGTTPGSGAGFNSSSRGFIRYEQTGNNEDDFAPIGVGSNSTAISTFDSQNCRMCVVNQFVNILGSGDQGLLQGILNRTPSPTTQRAILFPMYTLLRSRLATANPSNYFFAGYVPGVRMVNIQNLSTREVIDTDWEVYPLIQKVGSFGNAPVTGNVGLAYEITT